MRSAGHENLFLSILRDVIASESASRRRTEQRSGFLIKINKCFRVPPQDGSWRQRANLTFETRLYCLRFALLRNDRHDLSRFQNLPRRHRDRARRHLGNICEPALADLLPAARFVEIDDEIRIFGFEICRRIVKGNVPVLADAYESNIYRCGRQLRTNITNNSLRVGGIAIDQMMICDSSLLDQLFHQYFAKTRRMRDGQADIFIE